MTTAPMAGAEQARVAELRRYGILDTLPEQVFDDLTRLAAYVARTPIALVSLVDTDRQWFKARVGLGATETPRDISFCGHAVAGGEMLIVPDTSLDQRFADNPLVVGDPHIRFYAGSPLIAPSGHALGTLCVIDRVPRELDGQQIEMLEALGRQVMSQLDLRLKTAQQEELQQQLRYRTAELIEGEGRMYAILDNMVDGVITIDDAGSIESLNTAAARIFGYDATELLGKNVAVLMPDPHRGEHDGYLERYQRTGHATILGTRREVTGLRKSGEAFPMDLSVGEVQIGGRMAYTGVIRDITERKAIERAKNEFISVVSHELRTPLTSIRGSLGLIEGGATGAMPPKMALLIGIARSNTDRLVRLVNEILDLEKIEAGKLELLRAEIDPEEVVGVALAGIEALAGPARLTLVARPRSEPRGAVLADRDRLLQVLTNLLSNAVKFSPADGTVEALVEQVGPDRVRFSVRDRGPGIRVEDQRRLFERFHQLDASDSRSKGGTGLGLAICKAIVEEHGGRIGVTSRPGEGATFWFELAALAARHAPTAGAAPLILVVEDDPDVAQILRTLLENDGYRVVHAGKVADAVERLADLVPDAVLLDVALPDGTGAEVVARLRADPRTEDVPVIVVSGAESPQASSSAGVVDWVTKPFDQARLLRALRRVLRGARAPCVLIVDDDADTRRVLAEILRGEGITPVEAADGEAAIALAERGTVDLVLLDVSMPGMDGFAVVERLRRGRAQRTPLIVYTGRELSLRERGVLRLGATEHLTKGRASTQELLGTIRELLAELLAEKGPPSA